jgi:hypothetical protein
MLTQKKCCSSISSLLLKVYYQRHRWTVDEAGRAQLKMADERRTCSSSFQLRGQQPAIRVVATCLQKMVGCIQSYEHFSLQLQPAAATTAGGLGAGGFKISISI